jgi:hypothetical protein
VKKILVILVLISALMFPTCKSPVGLDEPELIQYRARVEVRYDRNPVKITFPEGHDKATAIQYWIYDPNARQNKLENEYVEGWYRRRGGANMEKIAENRFVGYMEKVFVQTKSHSVKHRIYVRDAKLYDGFSGNEVSTYTAEGITIEGAYDLEIIGCELHFRMSKQEGVKQR